MGFLPTCARHPASPGQLQSLPSAHSYPCCNKNKQTKKEHEANKPSATTAAAATTTKAATTTRKKRWRGLTLKRKQQALLANAKVPDVVRKC